MILRKGETKILVRGVDEILCVTRKEYKSETWYRMARLNTVAAVKGSCNPDFFYAVQPNVCGMVIHFAKGFDKQQTLKIEANKHMVL